MDQVEAYRRMYVIRRFEEQLMALVQSRELAGSVHLCCGQEAIPVGACQALAADDAVVGTYRGHGWAIARGIPLAELFAEILGRESGLCGGRGGSPYLMAPHLGFLGENSIVGAGVPMALGAALARKLRGQPAIAAVSIGDGAMNQGAVNEALNMAAVLRVPLLVVVENNGYAEMTPSDALTAVQAHQRAAAYRIQGVTVDGNDTSAVQDCIGQARAACLDRQQPVLVEAFTRRLAGHFSGDAQAYRPRGELEEARLGDPLARLAAAIGDEAALDRVRADADQRLAAALQQARQVPLPDAGSATRHVYAEAAR
jgi:TPP-dependent pyruvate/acetoin dehydrogenase alpha subunit